MKVAVIISSDPEDSSPMPVLRKTNIQENHGVEPNGSGGLPSYGATTISRLDNGVPRYLVA